MESFALVLFILVMRIAESMVGALRMVVLARSMTHAAAWLGFLETLIFAAATAGLFAQMDNFWLLLAYCVGYALGNYLGMTVEARLIIGFVAMKIIMPGKEETLLDKLGTLGHDFAAVAALGNAGEVTLLQSTVNRRAVPEIMRAVYAVNPHAFITMEPARATRRGWARVFRNQR
jgi:uncharacterized protein YebE (UPF0316 family)